jgi:hypothetical protein
MQGVIIGLHHCVPFCQSSAQRRCALYTTVVWGVSMI